VVGGVGAAAEAAKKVAKAHPCLAKATRWRTGWWRASRATGGEWGGGSARGRRSRGCEWIAILAQGLECLKKLDLKKKIADIAAGVADRSKVDTNRKLASLRIEWSLALLSKRKRSASQMLLYGGGWTWEWDLCTGNT